MGKQASGIGLWARRMTIVGALALTAGCIAQFRNHGYIPIESDLALVEVGVDTRETVLDKVGSPTTGGVLNDTGYYYVASRYRLYGWYEPEEITREVLAVTFTDAGRVRNIARYGIEDGQVVVLQRRVTDDNIADVSFIQQLIGNVGNVNAGALLGQP